jgi:hypothetical protein
MRELIPWWARIGAKLALSRLPAGYGLWHKLRLFTHGAMDQHGYALGVFQKHLQRAGLENASGFTALELGPGDSLASAVLARAYGASHTHLIDVGRFATEDMRVYRDLEKHLRELGLSPPDLERTPDLQAMLRACEASYSTSGIESLRSVPSASIDFIWSHAVLEHVRRDEFAQIAAETRRVMRPSGVCSHQIDLQDHLGGKLNNMRIRSSLWEANWMARSGFYTNRLKQSQIVDIFSAAGFHVDVVNTTRWDAPPISQAALAPEFRSVDTRELLVKGFEIVLRPR